MQAIKIDRKNYQLYFTWSDLHQSVFTISFLRRICPCAVCAVARSEHPDKTIEIADSLDHSIELRDLNIVGNYAVKISFSDGHQDGIYRFDYLRALCLCDACRQLIEN